MHSEEIAVFIFRSGTFLIEPTPQPLFPTLCEPKISGSAHFGKSRGSKSRSLARFRCAYWVVSHRALCSPEYTINPFSKESTGVSETSSISFY
jgi:hypothetical protein